MVEIIDTVPTVHCALNTESKEVVGKESLEKGHNCVRGFRCFVPAVNCRKLVLDAPVERETKGNVTDGSYTALMTYPMEFHSINWNA